MRPPLLDSLVDYAGLFPPARLPLAAAAAAYAAHRARPEAWMLGRFVVPVRQAADLAPLLPRDMPAPLAVLGTGGETADTFADALDTDLDALAALRHTGGHLRPEVFEVRLPGDIVAEPGTASALVERFVVASATAGLPNLALFLEVPLDAAGRASLPALLDVLGAHGAGLKLRTGGLSPADVPAPNVLAEALAAAVAAGVRFKCTAGLHHPVRMHRAEIGGVMHGFLNVFGGAALLHAGRVGADELAAVLADEDPRAFRLDPDGGFAWRDRTASAEEVRAARALATGFGSCSFDDPVDDLRALGML